MRTVLIAAAALLTASFVYLRAPTLDPLGDPSNPPTLSVPLPDVSSGSSADAGPIRSPGDVSAGDVSLEVDGAPEVDEAHDRRERALLEANLQLAWSPNPATRERAARELGERERNESAERRLRDLALGDRNADVRLAAINALNELGAVDSLADIARTGDTEEKLAALDAVEDLEPIDDADEIDEFEAMTTAALLDALDDSNPDVYERAAEMLEDRTDPYVVSSLWDKFFSSAEVDFERAEVVLDLLEYLDQEVDEAREFLDYVDPTDWATFSEAVRDNFPTPLDCNGQKSLSSLCG